MVGGMKGITSQSKFNLNSQKEKQILILCGENHCSSISNCSNSEIILHYLGLVFQFYIALN